MDETEYKTVSTEAQTGKTTFTFQQSLDLYMKLQGSMLAYWRFYAAITGLFFASLLFGSPIPQSFKGFATIFLTLTAVVSLYAMQRIYGYINAAIAELRLTAKTVEFAAPTTYSTLERMRVVPAWVVYGIHIIATAGLIWMVWVRSAP